MAVRAGAGTVLPRQDLLTEGLVHSARGRGIRMILWTLNTRDEVRRAMALGADGFATDDPCAAREWVEENPKGSRVNPCAPVDVHLRGRHT